jgi:hypothetical protein
MPAFNNSMLDLLQTSDQDKKLERNKDIDSGIIQLPMESKRLHGEASSLQYITALQILPFYAGYLPS